MKRGMSDGGEREIGRGGERWEEGGGEAATRETSLHPGPLSEYKYPVSELEDEGELHYYDIVFLCFREKGVYLYQESHSQYVGRRPHLYHTRSILR